LSSRQHTGGSCRSRVGRPCRLASGPCPATTGSFDAAIRRPTGYARGRTAATRWAHISVAQRIPMPRINLRAKLLATGAILLAFTAGISALSIATISGAVDHGTTIYDDGVVPLRNLGNARHALAHLNEDVVS